jgi:DNA-binding response OmpR family regulator
MLHVSETERYVSVDGVPRKIGRVSWRLLRALQNRRGEWASLNALIPDVYDADTEPDWAYNSLRVLTHRLRKQFGVSVVETFRGRNGSMRLPQ